PPRPPPAGGARPGAPPRGCRRPAGRCRCPRRGGRPGTARRSRRRGATAASTHRPAPRARGPTAAATSREGPMTTVDHSAPDATELDGDRPVIRPGDLLNVYEYQEIRHEFAAAAGLRPARVLMTPYGSPPLPRPPAGGADGTGRLPAGLAPEMAGHPVLWLPGGAPGGAR